MNNSKPNNEISHNLSDSIHTFHHLAPDSREPQIVLPIENDAKVYQKEEIPKKEVKPSVIGTSFLLSNMCLGTTIFTFAIRAKSFGLLWFIFFTIIVD